MKEFIFENWRWLISLIIGLLSVILLVFKKKYKVYSRSIPQFILEKLPMCIRTAERMFKAGPQKLDFVVSLVSDLLVQEFPQIMTSKYDDYIRDSVEAILSTPEKKEKED